jgi:hypothetical protein
MVKILTANELSQFTTLMNLSAMRGSAVKQPFCFLVL